MTAEERSQRTAAADVLCARAYAASGCPDVGASLVAVGGYGRKELAPYSDLDLVLVLDDTTAAGEWASAIWYPLWDSGLAVDHAVRTVTEVQQQATADLRVAMGLLDLRHLAGDPNLTLRLRAAVLAQWRRDARSRLAELQHLSAARRARFGELGHVSVPHLKESAGGLRDATVLKAMVASWLVDVPHADVERSRRALLDVRDALHGAAGRASDRVAPEYWPDIATTLGLPDADAAQRHTRGLGRRLAHLSGVTARRAEAVLRRPEGARARRPNLQPIAPGVVISGEEVMLGAGVRPHDPLLLLRAAAEAAERTLVLAPATAGRLARQMNDLPEPWPDEARHLLVRLLAAGPGLVQVWETLEETGAIERILPEWERVRLLPHASTIHRYTVDRHLVETCVQSAALIRRVARPDLLMVSALLHDIGKGQDIDHSRAGEPLARDIARRMGFGPQDQDIVALLVRQHLLLTTLATSRDLEDPATVAVVIDAIPNRETLDLLGCLTEADARATSEKAWVPWRAGLVGELIRRTSAALTDAPVERAGASPQAMPSLPSPSADGVVFEVLPAEAGDGSMIRVMAPDRIGLLADVALTLALARVRVRSVRASTHDETGISQWAVSGDSLDAAVLRQRFELVVAGALEVTAPLEVHTSDLLDPVVVVRPEASARATVIEVRAADGAGLLRTVLAALASVDISVLSAHVTTIGPQAVDVFYVQEYGAAALSDDRAAAAAHAVRRSIERRRLG